jgi:MFS superfamily sulfate permease-like transporter
MAAIVTPIAYALFGTSGQLSIGPEAMTSVLVGVVVSNEVAQNQSDPSTIGSSLALLCGIVGIIMAVIQAGFIDNVLSGYLLLGFVLGVSNIVMIEQLPNLLDLPHKEGLENGSALIKFVNYVHEFPNASLNTVYFAIASLFFLFSMKFIKAKLYTRYRWVQSVPDILLLVIISISLSYAFNFQDNQIKVLGSSFSKHLVGPTIPSLSVEFVNRNVVAALTIVIVGFFESETVIREFGISNNYFPSGDRVLFSISAVNIAASFFGGFPSFGSLPRSKIQAAAGGKTTVVGLIVGLLILLLFTTLGDVLRYLPKATIASIVFVAAYSLIEWDQIFFTFRLRKLTEISKFIATWAMTVGLSVNTGILMCLLFSALVIIRRSTSLNIALLGKLEVLDKDKSDYVDHYVDLRENGQAVLEKDIGKKGVLKVVILSLGGSIEYFNASRIARRMTMLIEANALLQKDRESVRDEGFVVTSTSDILFIRGSKDSSSFSVIYDFSKVEDMDSAALWVFKSIAETFKHSKGSGQLVLCGLKPWMEDLFARSGVKDEVKVFPTVSESVDFLNRAKATFEFAIDNI